MNLKPKYATSADACFLLIGGQSAYVQKGYDAKMAECTTSFDALIDKEGGSNPSEEAQHNIREICDNSCVYQDVMPLVRDWMSYDPNCYPRCIFALNVASGKIEQNPDLPAEAVAQIKNMTPKQRKQFIRNFDRTTGMKLEAIPLKYLTPEEKQDLGSMLEGYKPYTPFYNDNKAKHSKMLMWLIVLMTIGLILFLWLK